MNAKTVRQFFAGYETFQAIFEECNSQDMYNYVYVLKHILNFINII